MNREQFHKKYKLHYSKIERRVDFGWVVKSFAHPLQESIPELKAHNIEISKKMKRF